MSSAYLEHANLTVKNPDATAEILCRLFDWEIRWSGPAKDEGYTVHVGSDTSYCALYTPTAIKSGGKYNHLSLLNLNHLGVVVSNLEAHQHRAEQLGFTPYNFGDYEPGSRFYIDIEDGLEIEIISYEH